MSVNATEAALAYAQTAKRQMGGTGTDTAGATVAGGASFGTMVEQALESAVETGTKSEQATGAALNGERDLVDVVSAISAAEVTLQSVVAVRDRVISAYQEIMRMPI